jgi:hypothetical protein
VQACSKIPFYINGDNYVKIFSQFAQEFVVLNFLPPEGFCALIALTAGQDRGREKAF